MHDEENNLCPDGPLQPHERKPPQCPACYSEDITDLRKIGYQPKNAFLCHNCGNMWGVVLK